MGRFKVKPRGKAVDDLEAMPGAMPSNLISKDGNMSEQQQQHPTVLSHYEGHRGGVYGVKFRSNMKHLVSGGADGIVYLWSMHCRPNLRHPIVRPYRYVGHQGPVYAVAISPLDTLVASASKDKSIRLWIPTVEGKSSIIKGHTGPVRTVNFNHDGQWILTGSDDKTVKIWKVSNQKFICALSGHMNWIRSAEFNGNGRQVVSGSDDRTVRLWDLETHHCIIQFPDMLGEVYTTRFHPDGSCIASGNSKNCIQMWDVRSKSLIQHYRANGAVNSVCFHPSGNFLLSGCEDAALKIWDLREGQIVYNLRGHHGSVRAAEFSSTGEFFASGSKDENVALWRTNADFSCGQPGESGGNIVKKNEVGHSTCSACNCVCTSGTGEHPLKSHDNDSCAISQQDRLNASSPPKSSQSRRSRPNSPAKPIRSPSLPTPPKKHNADTSSESEPEDLDFQERDQVSNCTKTKVNIHKFGNKIEVPKTHFFEKHIREHKDGMMEQPTSDSVKKQSCKAFVCHLCEDNDKVTIKKDHYFSSSVPNIHSDESTRAKTVNKVDIHGPIDAKTIGRTIEQILSQLNTFTQTFGLLEERLSHFEDKMIQMEKRVGDSGTNNGDNESLFSLANKRC